MKPKEKITKIMFNLLTKYIRRESKRNERGRQKIILRKEKKIECMKGK